MSICTRGANTIEVLQTQNNRNSFWHHGTRTVVIATVDDGDLFVIRR